jgi:hypothetical protein
MLVATVLLREIVVIAVVLIKADGVDVSYCFADFVLESCYRFDVVPVLMFPDYNVMLVVWRSDDQEVVYLFSPEFLFILG